MYVCGGLPGGDGRTGWRWGGATVRIRVHHVKKASVVPNCLKWPHSEPINPAGM